MRRLMGFCGRTHTRKVLHDLRPVSSSCPTVFGDRGDRNGEDFLFRRRSRPMRGRRRALFNRVFFRARFLLFTFSITFYFCQIRSVVRERNLAGRAATNSGSGWDKFRVGRDKFRVWMGQIQGPDGTNSGSGRDKFRVWNLRSKLLLLRGVKIKIRGPLQATASRGTAAWKTFTSSPKCLCVSITDVHLLMLSEKKPVGLILLHLLRSRHG